MALLLALAMLPAGAIALQVGLNALEARRAAYEESLSRRALQSISSERGAIDELRELVRVVAASPVLTESRAGCSDWLRSVSESYPHLAAIAALDESGRIVCSYPAAPVGRMSASADLRARARTRDGMAMAYVGQGSLAGEPVLGAMEPIRNAAGRRIGYLGASISIGYLRELLDRSRTMDGARAAIVDYTGRVIAQSSAAALGDPGLPTAAQVRNHLGPDPAFIAVENGDAILAPLQAPDLYIAMAWAPGQPTWRRWGGLAVSVASPLLIWLLAIAAGWFAIEIYVARPLSNLEGAARSYARGEEVEDPPALASAPEEIRSLRRTMAAMAKTLRGREQRLIEALAEERALLREVHHRVKNNLQMVASLLNIQARSAEDESEAWGLARAHDRVQLLALVHQRIYASGEVRELRIDDLATEIARNLLQSRGLHTVNLQFEFSEVRTVADRAVPLAFMIGEAIAAALDALGDAPVDLFLHLMQEGDGEVRFAIASGHEPAGFDSAGPSGRLVDAFARQLGAQVGRDPQRPILLWAVVPPPRV